jgi:uncharacterized protein (DUF1330 family)
MTNKSIDPSADQVRALRDDGPEGPVVMLNLLKFRETADYGPDSSEPAMSGIAAYRHYQRAFTQTVGDVSQAEVLYDGPVNQVFIGVAGTAETDWDKVLLVRYPSRAHFLAMMAAPGYRDALKHRYAGLARTILLQCNG